MELEEELAEWCRKMGYCGPKDLSGTCNPLTRHIWEQLIQNVRPKSEVEYIRKNILLNRLRAKDTVLEKSVSCEFPIKEFELLKERQEVEERVKHFKKLLLEKTVEFEKPTETRKSTEAELDAQKSRTNSFERRKLLLEKKQNDLKAQLLQAKKMPAQQNHKCSNKKDIQNILKESANKLAESISDSHQDIKRGTILNVRTVNNNVIISGTVQDTITIKASEKLKGRIHHYATNIEKTLGKFESETVNKELQKCIKNSVFEFNQLNSIDGEEQPAKLSELDVAGLRFAHVKKELDILRQEKIIKEVNAKINERIKFVLSREQLTNKDNMKECLEKKLEQVAFNAISGAKKKIVNSVILESNTESDLMSAQILKVKQDIIRKKLLSQWTLKELSQCYTELRINQESARNKIYSIRSLISNTDWMDLLKEDLCYKEMKTFSMFPLEYQNNLRQSSFFDQNDISKHDRKLMLKIFGNSTTPPEKMLFKIWEIKSLLEHYHLLRNQQLDNPLFKDVSEKYSLQTLNSQLSRADAIAERLHLLLEKCTNSKALALAEKGKRSLEIWLQLPEIIAISSKRKLNGQDFQFYKKQLNRYA